MQEYTLPSTARKTEQWSRKQWMYASWLLVSDPTSEQQTWNTSQIAHLACIMLLAQRVYLFSRMGRMTMLASSVHACKCISQFRSTCSNLSQCSITQCPSTVRTNYGTQFIFLWRAWSTHFWQRQLNHRRYWITHNTKPGNCQQSFNRVETDIADPGNLMSVTLVSHWMAALP